MSSETQQPATAPLMSERRVSLIGAALVALGPISMALFTPAMPELVRVFGTTDSTIKLTLSLYFAGFALTQLICGPLSDGFGRKPIAIAFIGIYLVASTLALFAPTVEFLIAARFLQGAGAAVGVAISRAIVRDLFTNETSARIMNLIGLILGVGPAFSPTIGGIAMELFGWEAIFVLMVLFGIAVLCIIQFYLVETVTRDLSRIKPLALMKAYGQLMKSSYFISSGIALGGALGAFYTLAVVLPFILMNRIGMSPTAFGLGMLMQSGAFFFGSVTVRSAMARWGPYRIMPAGVILIAIASVALAVLLRVAEPTFLTVMGPVALYAFGASFILPAMSTAALAPFPHIAGAAGALSGFMQMGGGLVGGVLAGLFADPVIAMATVIPGLGATAIICWFWWKSLPEPALARTVVTRTTEKQPPE